jgi:chromosomal replication initiator protein
VREIEGAVNLIVANSKFLKSPITIDLCRTSLKDMFIAHSKVISIDNIQKQVLKFYNIRYKDLVSTSRARSVARPRQIAMYLAKELTSASLPEIGSSFGGRNHTTVLHAHKQVQKLIQEYTNIADDVAKITNALDC